MTDNTGGITVKQAAEILGIKERAVHSAIERKRIKAHKFAGVWVVSLESVLEYKDNRQHSGPKKVTQGQPDQSR